MAEFLFAAGEIEPRVHRQQANCHSHFSQVRRKANGFVRGLAGFVVGLRRIVYGKAGSILTPGLAQFGISKRVVRIQANRLLQERDRLSDALGRLLLKIKV